MYLEFLALALIEVFIIDISGAYDNLLKPITRKLLKLPKNANIEIPVIGCSLCTIFHTGWIFLLATGNFTILNFLFTTMIAFLSDSLGYILNVSKDLLNNLITIFYKWFN